MVLATNSAQIRRSIAILIAQIASIEIPRKEWLDLVPNLCSNASHHVVDIRIAAIETLGFICEELDPSDLTQELKNLLIQALVTNIQPGAEFEATTQLAIKAFFNAVPFTTHNFEV